MPALTSGKTAPDFTLRALDGKSFNLKDALLHGSAVLVFFKVSCPTCQYALPFYQRLFKAYKSQHVTLVGVSQNDADETKAFAKEFGISFPLLLDDTRKYVVSNAYGLTNVPTSFWIGNEGEVEITSVGWSRAEFDQINRKMAEAERTAALPIFQSADEVVDFRAG